MIGRLLPPPDVDLYEVPVHQLAMRKVAALAGDLRRKGIGGVKRPAFPTEDSKQMAFKGLAKAQRVGEAWGFVTPGILNKPGPKISQLVPKV